MRDPGKAARLQNRKPARHVDLSPAGIRNADSTAALEYVAHDPGDQCQSNQARIRRYDCIIETVQRFPLTPWRNPGFSQDFLDPIRIALDPVFDFMTSLAKSQEPKHRHQQRTTEKNWRVTAIPRPKP